MFLFPSPGVRLGRACVIESGSVVTTVSDQMISSTLMNKPLHVAAPFTKFHRISRRNSLLVEFLHDPCTRYAGNWKRKVEKLLLNARITEEQWTTHLCFSFGAYGCISGYVTSCVFYTVRA